MSKSKMSSFTSVSMQISLSFCASHKRRVSRFPYPHLTDSPKNSPAQPLSPSLNQHGSGPGYQCQCPVVALCLLLSYFSAVPGKGVATSGTLHFGGFQGAVLSGMFCFTLGCVPLTLDSALHFLATYILPRCSHPFPQIQDTFIPPTITLTYVALIFLELKSTHMTLS